MIVVEDMDNVMLITWCVEYFWHRCCV